MLEILVCMVFVHCPREQVILFECVTDSSAVLHAAVLHRGYGCGWYCQGLKLMQ
jgi:hypothetical protein